MSCYFYFMYCLLDLRSGECDVVSLYVLCFSVNGSVCLVCCVFDSVCELLLKQFAICFDVFAVLLLNVMDLKVWLEVLYWVDYVWCSKECVCCTCDPSERLDAPSICFVCVFICRKFSPDL